MFLLVKFDALKYAPRMGSGASNWNLQTLCSLVDLRILVSTYNTVHKYLVYTIYTLTAQYYLQMATIALSKKYQKMVWDILLRSC
jgi:hypothetical protein